MNSCKKDEQQKIFFQSVIPRHVDEKCFLARTFWFMISGLILWSEKFPPKFVFLEIQASPHRTKNKKLSCSFRCWDRRAPYASSPISNIRQKAATPGNAHLHDNVSRDFPFLYNQKLPKETTLLPIDMRHLTLNWPKPFFEVRLFKFLLSMIFHDPTNKHQCNVFCFSFLMILTSILCLDGWFWSLYHIYLMQLILYKQWHKYLVCK